MSYILKPSSGSIKNSKRIGRGNATGQGRTAGKGHKGYKSRSGTKAKFHFEGGQTPLARRLPKRGMGKGKFNHLSASKKNVYQIINLSKIDTLNLKKVDINILYKKGVIKTANIPLKILSYGELSKPIEISATFFSKRTIEKIEKSGGKVVFV